MFSRWRSKVSSPPVEAWYENNRESEMRNKRTPISRLKRKQQDVHFAASVKKVTSGAMRCMREINVGQSIGSRCTGSQVVIDVRLALILTPLINTSTFMQARSGSEVKGEECRPWRKVKCLSCASASFISRLQGEPAAAALWHSLVTTNGL